VSCILRQPDFESGEAERVSSEFIWNATSERAAAGDAFIVWSETATVVYGEKGESDLLSRAREILSLNLWQKISKRQDAGNQGPYLGLAYAMVLDGMELLEPLSQHNVFTLMLPNGTVGFKYHKSHAVPFVEAETIPGPGQLKAVETPFGIVSAAICFDYQFPRLIEQASYLG
jgi:predicted amidohydrolase